MVVHLGGLPEGWPSPQALCGQRGSKLRHTTDDERVTCKRCNRILDEQSDVGGETSEGED